MGFRKFLEELRPHDPLNNVPSGSVIFAGRYSSENLSRYFDITGEKHLEQMEKAGIDKTVVFLLILAF